MNAKRSSDLNITKKKVNVCLNFHHFNLFSSGQIAIMNYESKMDDKVLSRAIDQARFNKLQADMADIARKFKDRTARHKIKVSYLRMNVLEMSKHDRLMSTTELRSNYFMKRLKVWTFIEGREHL